MMENNGHNVSVNIRWKATGKAQRKFCVMQHQLIYDAKNKTEKSIPEPEWDKSRILKKKKQT